MNLIQTQSQQLQQPNISALLQQDNVKFDMGEVGKFVSTAGSQDKSVVEFLNWVFPYAAREKASDIHFSDCENGCRVRFRQRNMELTTKWLLNRTAAQVVRTKICNKCKLNALDIENTQDGSFFFIDDEREEMIDVRVGVVPTKFGSNITCRILDQANAGRSLDTVYMPEDVRESVLQVLSQEQGMVIVSGPTGSGKTSTLYSFLNHLNTPTKNIMTAEDPVEYRLPGANQVNIHPHFRPFDRVLREFLRQDPDIILVGETRDRETAETSVMAANTGHLLLSTIHANDALATVIRLINLGVERFALADALSAFFAQRLLNELCPHCRVVKRLTAEEKQSLKTRFPADTYFIKGDGCDKCDGTGRFGRIPVMEFAVRDEEVRQAILQGDFERLEQAMLAQPQYKTLVEAGLQISEQGLIDFYEAMALGVR